MKIALVAPTQIPARRANTIQVMKMAEAMTGQGHEVHLLSPGIQGSEADLADFYGLRQAPPVTWLPTRNQWRRYDYGLRAVQWAQDWKAELLYTRLLQAASLGSLLGLPTILELHDFPPTASGKLIFRAFLHGRGARRLVVITRALAEDLAKHLGAPGGAPFTQVEPDGVDLERYAGLPEPAEARRALAAGGGPCLDEGTFTAGYTGHLYPGRGIELLMELAARLPAIQFLIVGGETADTKRLQSEAKGIPNLTITGFIPNASLPRYQAACEALLMPYGQQVAASSGGNIARYLSPMKLFEYLACGRAILSSDLPVLREVLTSDNAVLLPPGESEAWANALLELQTHPDRGARLGAEASRNAASYSWSARAERILEGLPTP